jgi:hypothetical protein
LDFLLQKINHGLIDNGSEAAAPTLAGSLIAIV